MVKLLRTLLELDGYSVVQASRAAEVLPTARQTLPDVVLMDVHLADADGLEVLGQLRADAQLNATPVIMSSGLNMEAECRRAGANAFILKPYPPNELVDTIRTVLG